jgi:dTMP kinase
LPGTFITFEGIDKSGKSTQAERLADTLREQGLPVVLTLEPGGTELGKAIRHLVLEKQYEAEVAPTAEVLLFAGDRAQHVEEVIRPGIQEGKVVISDRFVDSTMAYQGYGRGLDMDRLAAVMRVATGGLVPDITMLVDVDLETARARGWGTDPDRIERGSESYFERVRNGFLALSSAEPGRIRVFDGRQDIDALASSIRAELPDDLIT